MTQEIKIGNDIVILDSERHYSGIDNPNDDEKLVRKAIGFPVKKQLVYYRDKLDQTSVVNIKEYQLVEMYNITERWYTVEITTEQGEVVRIHSAYLIEMQKPSFVADMSSYDAKKGS